MSSSSSGAFTCGEHRAGLQGGILRFALRFALSLSRQGTGDARPPGQLVREGGSGGANEGGGERPRVRVRPDQVVRQNSIKFECAMLEKGQRYLLNLRVIRLTLDTERVCAERHASTSSGRRTGCERDKGNYCLTTRV